METARLSTKGQILLPKNIRTSRAWRPGTEFIVEERPEGILPRLIFSKQPHSMRWLGVFDPDARRALSDKWILPFRAKQGGVRIAVDTKVLVRLLTEDGPQQAAAARSLVASEPIWIAKTVLLETFWVLRRGFVSFDRAFVRRASRMGVAAVSELLRDSG